MLFLHGGPGAGATPVHRRFFDPSHWRIVIFDQRGGGRSTPLGEIRDNSPEHLVADIERLRRSWGSPMGHLRRLVGLDLGADLRRSASASGWPG